MLYSKLGETFPYIPLCDYASLHDHVVKGSILYIENKKGVPSSRTTREYTSSLNHISCMKQSEIIDEVQYGKET